MEYNDRLNELKSLILLKLGIRFITPADCKRISIEISKHLNKNVSETTIKRLYGFAVVKHNFSTFTLTTLAEYVDMAGIAPESIVVRNENPDEWEILREKTDQLTRSTLKTIKNRSGIPYEMTISRKFAEHDFYDFYNNDRIFSAFISQPGYGKTILLSHLVEDLFYKEHAAYKNCGVFFMKAISFYNKENLTINLEEQIKTHLQLSAKTNTLSYINKLQGMQGGKFYIILDGFAELILKKEEKNILYDGLINLICALEDCKNIKLILSMRSTAWIRFFDRMRHSAFLKSKWFSGNYFNLHELTNVPPLTEKEVEIIISKINYLDNKEINPRLKSQLKFPFHIQLYYQLKEEDPDFNYYTNITFYELVSRFIQEKIYRSNYYTEKILFLKKIIQLTAYGKKSNYVEKDMLIAELSAFRNAYMELLADGILMEEKRTESSHPKEFVRFLHPHMFEYFLFVEILEKFHLQVNKDFFNYINTEYDYNQVRFQLLQWSTRFLIKTGNFHALKSFFKLELNSFETNYLVLFIAEEVKYRSKYNHDILAILDEDKFHDMVISKLTNFDFIDSCYKEAVLALIEIARNEEHLLVYYTILGILEVNRLDSEGISDIILKIRSLSKQYWPIDPADMLELIHAKLSGATIVHGDILIEIRKLEQGKGVFAAKGKHQIDAKEGIYLGLVLLVNIFMGDNQSSMKIVEQVAEMNGAGFLGRNLSSMYMLAVYGNFCARLGAKKSGQIENILVMFAGKNNPPLTKFMESLILMLQAQQAYNRKEYNVAISHAKESLIMFKRNEAYLNAVFMYNLLVQIYAELGNYDRMNEYKYEKLCMLDDQALTRQLF